jgi:hypothetical protein
MSTQATGRPAHGQTRPWPGQNMVSPAHGPHINWPVHSIATRFYGEPSPWPDLPNSEMLKILKCNLEKFEMLKILKHENSGNLKF